MLQHLKEMEREKHGRKCEDKCRDCNRLRVIQLKEDKYNRAEVLKNANAVKK